MEDRLSSCLQPREHATDLENKLIPSGEQRWGDSIKEPGVITEGHKQIHIYTMKRRVPREVPGTQEVAQMLLWISSESVQKRRIKHTEY